MRLVCNKNRYSVSILLYHTVIIIMCVYNITNIMINTQYLLSSINVVASLSLSLKPYPSNCATCTVIGDTFHTEREWHNLALVVSYKMEYSVLYDIIIMMLCMILLQN